MSKIRPLNPDLQHKAIEELNENTDNIEEEIASIRRWISEQPTLGKYQLSDQFILSFLRSCKYKHETVYKKLPNFLNMRFLCPEILGNRRVTEEFLDLVRTGFHISLLSTPNEIDNSRISLTNYGKLDMGCHTLYEGIKLIHMILEVNFLEDDNTAVAGISCVEDMTGLSFSHVISMNLMVLKRILDFVRCGLPHRIKGIHLINVPWFASGILSITRSLLPAKLKSRFFVHRKVEHLYEHIPQKNLPAEYGGDAESVDDLVKIWDKKFQQFREYFEHDLQFGTGYEHEV